MKKRDGSINRLLYTLLALCVFIIMGMGVFIVNAYGGTQPSVMGHSVGEMNWGDSIPSLRADSFEAGSINLGGVPRTSWPVSGITSETDPTVIASVKDGVSWSEISSIPADFADGVDNVGSGVGTLSCTFRFAEYAPQYGSKICASYGETCVLVWWDGVIKGCSNLGTVICCKVS